MSNFVAEFKQGKEGLNRGWSTGLPALDKAIHGLQQKTSIGIAAAPKAGKTTFVDYAFLLAPYLQAEREGRLDEIEWIYFSFEIDRVSKEFKFAAFFMAYDYKIFNFVFNGVTYPMSQDYLQGKLTYVTGQDKDGFDIKATIPVSEEHEKLLKEIYRKRIIPIFGEYDENGNKIQPGKIVHFIEEQDNPTGMYKFVKAYAAQHGTFTYEKYVVDNEVKERETGYKPHNPKVTRIVIGDHIRKLLLERGFTIKQNIDKWLEYSTILRNRCRLTFIHVAHSNRGVANTERLRFAGEMIFPTGDDVKDSGNLSEECTIMMTLMNPGDEKYNLIKHFGVELKDNPNYRSLHIVEARYVECPQHIQMNMYGNINLFTPLIQY